MSWCATWLALGVSLCGFLPARARACLTTSPPPSFQEGVPADGATDVPTDVRFYYPIPFAALSAESDEMHVPGMFTLTGADGNAIALSARRVHIWNYELVPATALAPNTAYTLRGSWVEVAAGNTVQDEVRFNTGAGPLAQKPPLPRASMAHFSVASDHTSSCGPPTSGTCISMSNDDAWLEYTYVDNFGQLQHPGAARGSFQINLSGVGQGTNFECILIRTRALNGTTSDPLELCGADVPVQELTGLMGLATVSCTSAGFAWRDDTGPKGQIPAPAAPSGRAPAAGAASQGAAGAAAGSGQFATAGVGSQGSGGVAATASQPSAGAAAASGGQAAGAQSSAAVGGDESAPGSDGEIVTNARIESSLPASGCAVSRVSVAGSRKPIALAMLLLLTWLGARRPRR